MGLFDIFRRNRSVLATPATPLTPEELREAARTFQFRHTWTCACGATLVIRSREDRSAGPSNFKAYPPGHVLAGHATLPSGVLTWDGMAEERGWLTRPTQCPACQQGITVSELKTRRRLQQLG